MATHARADYDHPDVELTVLPRYAVQLPFELPLPAGFDAGRSETWPRVAGREDTVEALEQKARWYLDHGVEAVWIAIPRTRTVRVLTRDGASEHGAGERLPRRPST